MDGDLGATVGSLGAEEIPCGPGRGPTWPPLTCGSVLSGKHTAGRELGVETGAPGGRWRSERRSAPLQGAEHVRKGHLQVPFWAFPPQGHNGPNFDNHGLLFSNVKLHTNAVLQDILVYIRVILIALHPIVEGNCYFIVPS